MPRHGRVGQYAADNFSVYVKEVTLTMPIHDLRSYLDVLEGAGQLARIAKQVNLDYELANVAACLEQKGGPAPLFLSVVGSPWPILASAVANQERAALALDCEKDKVVDVMCRAMEPSQGVSPIKVDDAPWKANVMAGADVDLGKLPVPLHAVGDAGRFVTGGVAVTRDPCTGRGNLSYNRMQVQGKSQFGFHVGEWRHISDFLRVVEARGEPLPVAVAIGLDPALMIAAGARYDGDEMCIAGAIRGKGVQVSRGVTVDLDVPAEAEIIIEGYLPPGVRDGEGPLAEFHGSYGGTQQSSVLHVTAVCWRDNPIYQTIIPGWHEHVYHGAVLTREPVLLKFVRYVSNNVTCVHLAPYASGFMAIIALNKTNPGEPKNVALAAFASHVNIKLCVVVDSDIDVYVPTDVMWALTTRVDWSKDVFLVPGAQGIAMEPTADERGVHTKIGVDATADKGRRQLTARVHYDHVDLAGYLNTLCATQLS